jgi:hypothetical protein
MEEIMKMEEMMEDRGDRRKMGEMMEDGGDEDDGNLRWDGTR